MAARYVFGDFELDEARFELCCQGSPVPAQPKVLKMLLHLVTHRDRAVGAEELFRVLWPDERVGLASIKRAVIGVRRALGESGDSQTSVRTVRGFGYQFTGEVRIATAQRAAYNDATPAVPSSAADTQALSDALTAAVRRHLDAACVLGREFSIALLAEVMSSSIEQVFPGVCTAVTAQLLGQARDTAGRYFFVDEGLRDRLYEALTPSERARLHGETARALEARGPGLGDAHLLEVAGHYFRAAPTHDRGRALAYTLQLARSQRPQISTAQVVTLFVHAMQLLELNEPSSSERMELLLELGAAQRKDSQVAEARQSLLAAAEIAQALGRIDVLIRVTELLGAGIEAGHVDGVQVRLLREARVGLADDDTRVPLLDALLARALCYAGQLEERAELAMRAFAATPELAPRERAAVFECCHEALSEPSHRPLRLAISMQLGRLAQRLNDPVLVMRGSIYQIRDALELGDLTSVDAALATLALTSEHTHEPTLRWYVPAYRCIRAYIAGDLVLAEQLAGDARALNTAADADHVHAAQVIGTRILQGKVSESEALIRAMSARYPRLSGWRALLGSLQLQTGRPELARAALYQLLDEDLQSLRGDPFVLSALTPCADLCAQLGDERAARRLYDAILPHAQLHSLVHLGVATWGSTERHLGMLAATMHELERAVVHFESALSSARSMASPTLIALTELSYGGTLLVHGRPAQRAQAAALLQSALTTSEQHAFAGLALHARKALAACGAARVERPRLSVLRGDARHAAR